MEVVSLLRKEKSKLNTSNLLSPWPSSVAYEIQVGCVSSPLAWLMTTQWAVHLRVFLLHRFPRQTTTGRRQVFGTTSGVNQYILGHTNGPLVLTLQCSVGLPYVLVKDSGSWVTSSQGFKVIEPEILPCLLLLQMMIRHDQAR